MWMQSNLVIVEILGSNMANLNSTVSANRTHIGFFGLRNAGKSSVVNAITNQSMSLVSNIKGTTTDPVKKSMEILPIGPVVIVDTPGMDDEGTLGELRIKRTLEVLKTIDQMLLKQLCWLLKLLRQSQDLSSSSYDDTSLNHNPLMYQRNQHSLRFDSRYQYEVE